MTATLTIALAVAALASSAAIAQAPPRSTESGMVPAAATTMAPGPAAAATANTLPAAGRDHAMEGLAAYYATHLDGHKTASGKSFDQNALIAAHRTLPFGTNVRVVNKKNGRSVIVRIVDRGPTEPA